ncbi:NAD-dependent epimerase/dehydratase family protein [Chryseobacterium sp. VAUSW3]|uniref:NAD-dependent epimerase/dehydratase family protein n=1 Tax=Chryseobacterium sp. VAUSW3 TaxID=2010998 RepID=UPI000B4CE84B|nr:NAD-dependent epimerase/dehydratase family protein [Chryseobacterium sp. VAUSW3]OWR15085.1 NAD-dependent epimerase [Chryseobacterium sp. VAUSW3]
MVLVTGATGILGRVIVLELLKRGKIVRAAKRRSSNLEEVRHSFQFYTENPDNYFNKIEWMNVDFEDIHSLQTAMIGIDEVYHCAATVSFHPADQRRMYHTNIEGTRNLLYACEGSQVKKFCFVSSIAVLDGVNEKDETDENSDYNQKLDHSAYAVSKHFSEMEVWRAAAEGLNTVIVNPGIIIGSGNWTQSSGLLFQNLARPYTFSGGASYVDVRDVAKASIELMDNNVFNERFILISENKRYAEVASYVRQKMGLSSPKIIPSALLTVGRVLNFVFGWLFSPLRMVDKVNTESVTSMSNVSNDKIVKTLGFKFIPVNESIDFHLENYRTDKKSKKE